MSDVGDGVELTFASRTGAAVTATTTAPDGTVASPVTVEEDPAGSGSYPFRFVLTQAGMWRVTFVATGAVTATEHSWVFAEAPGPPPLATADQLAAVFRPLSPEETQVVSARLAQASQMLRGRFRDIDSRIASGDLPASMAAAAAIGMVLRVVRNPGGLRAETVGPFRREFTADGANAQLEITAAEEALIGRAAGESAPPPARTVMARAGLAYPDHYGWGRVRRW